MLTNWAVSAKWRITNFFNFSIYWDVGGWGVELSWAGTTFYTTAAEQNHNFHCIANHLWSSQGRRSQLYKALSWQLLEVVVAIIIIIIIIIKRTTHPDDEQQHHHHQHEGAMWGKNANESQEYYVWR